MKDKVLSRAASHEGKSLKGPNGKGNEVSFPTQNPGDSAYNKPGKTGPHVKTNT